MSHSESGWWVPCSTQKDPDSKKGRARYLVPGESRGGGKSKRCMDTARLRQRVLDGMVPLTSGMRSAARFPVMLVTAPGQFGGLESVVAALALGLRSRGWPLHALAFLDAGTERNGLVERLEAGGVAVRAVQVRRRAYRFERAALRRAAGEVGAQLVHTHGARVDVIDSPVARRLGLATVTTLHGFTGGGLKNRTYERLQLRVVRRCDAVVAVSRAMMPRLEARGVPTNRLHLIPNAFSPDVVPLERAAARAALGVSHEGLHIGWVGRLTPEKGADVLLAAVARLIDLPLAVSIVGDGLQADRLRVEAEALGVASRITWHGHVTDAGRFLRAFDLFVLSSRTEGTPIALFEAIAAGVPVVTTAVGGVPDVVTNAEAMLVPPGDPTALAAAVRRALLNPEAALDRARAAKGRIAERFQVEPWLEAYEKVYRDVVDRRKVRNRR